MKDDYSKILSYVLYALMGISALLSILYAFDFLGYDGEGVLLGWTYFLVGIAVLSAVVFPIIQMAKNPKSAKGVAISLLGLAVVFGISYGLASGEVTPKYEKYLIDESTSRLVGMAVNGFFIMFVGTFLVAVGSGIMGMLKGN